MKPISARDRTRYWIDSYIARGPSVLIVWLIAALLLIVFVAAAVVYLARIAPLEDGGRYPTFWRVIWTSLIHFLDNGNFSGDNPRHNVPYIFTMGIVTLLGIGFTAVLTGVLTTSISARLEAMRKGRSIVSERGHTVILGWSPHIYTAVAELIEAYRNHRGHTIAVLAPKDKVEMEDRLRDRVGPTYGTRLVCRSGLPMDLNDLSIAQPFTAKSVIVLAPAPEDSVADPDAEVIKTLLALTNSPQRGDAALHIVAEIRAKHNLEAAQLAGGAATKFVLADDLIARITAQTCRQSGLSVVISELLSFQGNEFYFIELPGLVGQSFSQAQLDLQDGVLVGIRRKDGQILLCPPEAARLEAGDQAVVIAEADTKIKPATQSSEVDFGLISVIEPLPPAPEKTLILGWNARAAVIVEELEQMVAAGSSLRVLVEELHRAEVLSLEPSLQKQSLEVRIGDATDSRVIAALNPAEFQHVITLGDSSMGTGVAGIQAADAHTLVTLLHLRQINQQLQKPFAVVSEMLDPQNRPLAEITEADDFIVSDRLVSLAVTQIAENPELAEVWSELLNAGGITISLHPIGNYINLDKPVNFWTLLKAAQQRGEVAIGYRLKAQASDQSKNYGVKINPPKAQLQAFGPRDKLIVLGQ